LTCKNEYDAEVAKNKGKTRYDNKRKRHMLIKPTTGYVAKAVGQFYSDKADVLNDDPAFEKATKLVSRSLVIYIPSLFSKERRQERKYQWSESGSYRFYQMLKTISNLPNRCNPFTQKDFAIPSTGVTCIKKG